jgi:hypothetical protein
MELVDFLKAAAMLATARFFERVIAKAHHQISADDPSLYSLDFAGLLTPRDPALRQHFREVASSLSALFAEKKVLTFVMFYDTVAFCMRFHSKSTLEKVNPAMVAEALSDLPRSGGAPSFVIGTNAPTYGFGWREAHADDEELKAEIFPLLDFPGVCLYYARLREGQARPNSQTSDSQSQRSAPGSMLRSVDFSVRGSVPG